jgi:hypothetical protein
MYGHAWSSIASQPHRNMSTLSKLSTLGISNTQSMPGLAMNLNKSVSCTGSDSSPRISISSLMGDPETEDSSGQKDMRQVRLFKTRFCSYGTDCPYLARGKCLYAHNKDEIRFRPPPPSSYKKSASPKAPTALGSESVWSVPSDESRNMFLSLFDFMPPRQSPSTAH